MTYVIKRLIVRLTPTRKLPIFCLKNHPKSSQNTPLFSLKHACFSSQALVNAVAIGACGTSRIICPHCFTSRERWRRCVRALRYFLFRLQNYNFFAIYANLFEFFLHFEHLVAKVSGGVKIQIGGGSKHLLALERNRFL